MEILEKHGKENFINHIKLYDYRNDGEAEPLYDRVYEDCLRYSSKISAQMGVLAPPIVFDTDDSPTGQFRFNEKCITYSNKIMDALLGNVYTDAADVISEYGSQEIQNVVKCYGFTASNVLTYFTFKIMHYHECGHMIQSVDELTKQFRISSQPFLIGNKIPWSYLKEIDSDWFSIDQFVKESIEVFLKKNGTKVGDCSVLEGELSIGLAVLFNFLYRAIDTNEIYFTERFKDKSHPHPIIRVELIKQNFETIINKYLPIGVTLQANKIINDAKHLTVGMFEADKIISSMPNFVEEVNREVEEKSVMIAECIEGLKAIFKTIPELAMNGKAARFGLSKF